MYLCVCVCVGVCGWGGVGVFVSGVCICMRLHECDIVILPFGSIFAQIC